MDGAQLKVDATQTDKASNTSAQGSDQATVGDTTAAGAPVVTIVDDGVPGDGVLTKAEIGDDNIQVTVQVNAADLAAGGKVNLTINNGGTLSNVELTEKVDGTLQSSDGKSYSYNAASGTISWTETRPVDGAQLKVDATQTDKASNTSAQGSDQATVGDTTAAGAPVVTIVDDGVPGDGVLTKAEIGDDNIQVTVQVNAADLAAGGKVNLTINNGGTLSNVELTQKADGTLQSSDGKSYSYNAASGTISWTETRPVDGAQLKVDATQTDKASNTSAQGSDQATVGDTTAAGAPVVTIVDDGVPGDGVLTKAEIGDDNIQVTVQVNAADLAAGGKVNLTINNGGTLSNVELTEKVDGTLQSSDGKSYSYNAASGTISWTETRPVDGAQLKVDATQTDKASNTSAQGSDQATVGDTTAAGAPVVTIVDDGVPGDGVLTKAEIGDDNIQVTVQVNAADLAAGGKVNLTINNGDATSTVELKLVNGVLQLPNDQPATGFTYNNGTISWTETTPANGKSLTVSATQTDKAGNVSLPGSDTALVLAAPTTSGGYAQGEEDMTLTLKWSDFKASDVDTAADKLSIKITSLPADGGLQYKDANGNWQAVVENQVFTQAEIVAGKLQFLPDQHEASGSVSSGANTGADGNKLGDYASFGYQVSDGVNNSGNATFVVDIKPVVDGVTLKVELVSGGFVPGSVKVEQIVSGLNGKTPSTSPTGGDDYLVSKDGNWVQAGGATTRSNMAVVAASRPMVGLVTIF